VYLGYGLTGRESKPVWETEFKGERRRSFFSISLAVSSRYCVLRSLDGVLPSALEIWGVFPLTQSQLDTELS
jgi:hypothetical protein